ncbi:MAG: hypothetical protein ACQETO_06470 [Pseudomonadota bacterium]
MHTTRTITMTCRSASLAVLFLCASLASASPFGDHIPRALAEALLADRPGQAAEMTFSSAWPDAIPEIALPEGVTVLGHLLQSHGQLRLALGAEAPIGLRRQQVLSALEEVGYQVITPPPQARPNQRGFVDATGFPDQMTVQVCDDDQGVLRVAIAGEALVLTTTPRAPMQVDCEEMRARFDSRSTGGDRHPAAQLQRELPRLELPTGATSRQQSPFSRFGTHSTPVLVQTHGEAVTELSLEALHQHLAGQLPEQGWTLDGESTGGVQAISSWTRSDEDQELLGTLDIVAAPDPEGPANVFRLRFAVQVL